MLCIFIWNIIQNCLQIDVMNLNKSFYSYFVNLFYLVDIFEVC